MKILVLNKSEFEQPDIDFLGMLEESKEFEKLIGGIRGKYGLPREGHHLRLTPEGKFESSSFGEKVCEDIDSAEKWIRSPIMDVIHAFNLPIYWQNTIYSIILFGAAIPPQRFDEWYQSVEIRYQGSLDGLLRRVKKNYDHTNEIEPHLTIVVREKMSLSQLIKELRKQGDEITRYLSYLDETPSLNVKDVGLRKKMLSMKKDGKSGDEIAEKLDDEFKRSSGEKYTLEKNQVNRYNVRFEDMVKKTVKNLPSRYFDMYLSKYLE